MWHRAQFARDVSRLLDLAKRQAGVYPGDGTPYRHRHVRGGTPIVFHGEALQILRSLTSRIVGDSRLDVGVSEKQAESLLFDACAMRVDGATKQDSLRWLLEQLDEPVTSWTVVEPVDLVLVGKTSLTVGRSSYTTAVPREATKRVLPMFLERLPADAYVSTRVTARDAVTARIVAREAFADSAALLDLMDPPSPAAPGGSYIALPGERARGGISFGRSGWIIDSKWLGNDRKLISPFRQLSRAFEKVEGDRTDWERRVVAGTRWLSRAHRSSSTADRLVAQMVVLEALFIRDRSEKQKGRVIARRLADRMRLRSLTRQEQEDWVTTLYQRRNDAVHEGREYLNDLEVEEMLGLVRYTLRYACEHLASRHAGRRRACRTFDEAMKCGLWYGAHEGLGDRT